MIYFFSIRKKSGAWKFEWSGKRRRNVNYTRFRFAWADCFFLFANCPLKIDCHLIFHGFDHYSVGIVVAVGVWHGCYGYCVLVLRSHYCHRSTVDPFELFHWWNLNNGSAVKQQSMMLHILGHPLFSAFSLDAKRCDKRDALLYSINGQRFGMYEARDRHLLQLELFDGIFQIDVDWRKEKER